MGQEMGEVQQLLQHLFNEIETFLSQAQATGRVEKYHLEVVVPAWQPGSSQTPSEDAALHTALCTLLSTLQEIVDHCSSTEVNEINQEGKSYTSQHESSGTDACHSAQHLYDSEVQDENHVSLVSDHQHVNLMEEYIMKHLPGEHHNDQMVKRLPPQQPTTKETEAANVLMNLSGKAADRTSHTRLGSSLPSHQEFIIPDVGKPSLYLLPPGTSYSKFDSGIKREYPLCDEVPQINEKDLLPLATQVLCQFCSRQCEDLVELHEHVLAMHNIPEPETPLMPSYKRVKNHSEDEDLKHFVDGKRQKQDIENHAKECAKDSSPLMCTNTLSEAQESSNKQYMEEKKLKRKPKLKKGDKKDGSWSSEDQSDPSKVVNSDLNKNCIMEFGNTPPSPKENTLGSELDTYCPQEQILHKNLTQVKSDSLYDKDETWLKRHTAESITELTPVGSDALAIAIESSQIRVIEAKVTIFVCIKCSCGFTDNQEFTDHICHSSQPFVRSYPDGSVALVNDNNLCEDHLQLPDNNVWYFPEFFIRRPGKEEEKTDGSDLHIIHSSSGRRLHLLTTYQPAYLSERLICFRCPTCENDCDSLGRFLEHLTKGPCMFRCPECNLVYSTQEKLQKHRASLHPTLEDRTCPNCHMVFEKRHQRNKHLKTKCSHQHSCVICGGVLKNEYNLRVHMQSHEVNITNLCTGEESCVQ
ncbi:uncharacterized protein LOC121872173 isoform X2 [Homarus americanus]|uniref:uncharacterized protein LOC121872173 isoform X2 n=1 Tax=Homarus americanus TaxID=6706 RepID=UPI001C481DD7|nr:uncharacterized protein LOC121872173 isoform X2 [Homarus americanus]